MSIAAVRRSADTAGRMSTQIVDTSIGKSSPFLALPAELRNTIYNLLLRQPLHTGQYQIEDSSTSTQRRFCARILLTCKQVNLEATLILYSENVFCAHESLLATMPSMILTTFPSPTYSRPVKHKSVLGLIKRFYLRVRLDTDPRYSAWQAEESFTGAEELDIEVFQAMFDSCSFAVLSLFEGVRGVGKASVRGSVGDGRYAAWLARTMMLPRGTRTVYDDDLADEYERQKMVPWNGARHVWDYNR